MSNQTCMLCRRKAADANRTAESRAYQALRLEVIRGLSMGHFASMVQTPGFGTPFTPLVDVIADQLDGRSSVSDILGLLHKAIHSSDAVVRRSALQLVDGFAHAHANFHKLDLAESEAA